MFFKFWLGHVHQRQITSCVFIPLSGQLVSSYCHPDPHVQQMTPSTTADSIHNSRSVHTFIEYRISLLWTQLGKKKLTNYEEGRLDISFKLAPLQGNPHGKERSFSGGNNCTCSKSLLKTTKRSLTFCYQST